ncbi:MAG: HAD family phosphatase [Chitinophagaceae bacterium]|nr:HAD family phosphatase [Chitinophagaceae bacterium]
MNKAKAFIFDMNGTMVDDMQYHSEAWFNILNNDLGANLSRERVNEEMYGKNAELLERVFGSGKFSLQEMDSLSMRKEKRYQEAFLPELKLIDGLDAFLKKARDNDIQMAIGSAAIPFNIDFVLDGLQIRHYFKAVVSADDVSISKPHPETFLKCAALLGVKPEDCIVFEDAPKGVEAAQNAGMKAVALTTMHGSENFSKYTNVIAFIEDYNDPLLQKL